MGIAAFDERTRGAILATRFEVALSELNFTLFISDAGRGCGVKNLSRLVCIKGLAFEELLEPDLCDVLEQAESESRENS